MSVTGTDLRHLDAFESISVETRLPCSLVNKDVVALGGVAGTAAPAAAALGGDSIDICNIERVQIWEQFQC